MGATTDHETIRRWVEARGGYPAHVKRTGRNGDAGMLRIDFPRSSGRRSLEKIGWDEFFRWFDKNELAFVYYEDEPRDRKQSRFNKVAGGDAVPARAGGAVKASRRQPAKRAAKRTPRPATKRAAKRTTARTTKPQAGAGGQRRRATARR
jgi:hypothetical protein